jgi:hypothetical protein
MAYFPNGTSHQCYLEALCTRCLNFRDLGDGRGPGCPIIDLHFEWNYEAINDDTKRHALNHFIPLEKVSSVDTVSEPGAAGYIGQAPSPVQEDEFGHKTINGDCLMFLPADQGDPE